MEALSSKVDEIVLLGGQGAQLAGVQISYAHGETAQPQSELAALGVRFDISCLAYRTHTESPVRDTIFGIKTHGSDTRSVV